jgi:hypothetical protein
MSRRKLYVLGAVIAIIIWVGSLYLFLEKTKPPPDYSFTEPWTNPDYPTGTGWLLYPNGREVVSGVITIEWDTSKTPKLGPDDKIWIGWTHCVRGAAGTEGNWSYPPEVFEHETWEGCYCSTYEAITTSAPNTGEYQWNTTETLEWCNGEHYPYYIKLVGGVYMDATKSRARQNRISVSSHRARI